MQVLDQTGHTIRLKKKPVNIISLVPSQTELLYDLQLAERVKGITKFCVHPEHWQKEKNIIGGTKNLNIRKILDLEPDLIIANKEENRKKQIEELKEFCPVYISDIRTINDALEMISDIGRLTGTESIAEQICLDIEVKFTNFKPEDIKNNEKVVYLIWKSPLMVVGNDNFIHSLLEWAGWKNAFEDRERYPTISVEDLKKVNPDRVLLSTEPYPFTDEDISFFKEILPMSKVHLVDGERFSWYGSRMKQTPAYIHAIQTI